MADEQSTRKGNGTAQAVHEALMSTDDVKEFLTQVARMAADTVAPAAELSCGITVRRDGHPMTVVSSDDRAVSMDEVQYETGDGPCLHALRTEQVVLIDDLATDPAWESYRERGLNSGVHSCLSLPIAADGVRAAMNLYAAKPHAFDSEAIERGQALADDTSRAMVLAIRIAEHIELNGQLRTALVSRAVIDQAIGIIMGQNRCTPEAGFDVLRRASQNRNVKMRVLASDIVTSTADQASTPTS